MKNNNKTFDGDKIYAMAMTLFAGVCSVGIILAAAIENLFWTSCTISKERLIMKNNDKVFDGDKIYAMAVTLFAGVCAVGAVVTVAVQNIF